MNRYQGQNKACGFCRRKWPAKQTQEMFWGGRYQPICRFCVEAMKDERDAASVRRLSEEKGRKR